MNYAFFGTPDFAAIILKRLIASGDPPSVVVCNPDRPVGRKKIITSPPTKTIAQKSDILALQPEQLDRAFGARIASFNCDFFIVAAYAKIIPAEILQIPPLGTIGVHPSLLPKYRGASPIQSVILAGERETGVTLYLLDEKMDHGPILASAKLKRESGRPAYEELQKELAELGGNLLVATLPMFFKDLIKGRPQNEAEATYTKKFTTEDGFVSEADLKNARSGNDPKQAAVVDRKILALNPEPGVWTLRQVPLDKTRDTQGKQIRVKLLEAVVRDERLVLKKIQEEGGRAKLVS